MMGKFPWKFIEEMVDMNEDSIGTWEFLWGVPPRSTHVEIETSNRGFFNGNAIGIHEGLNGTLEESDFTNKNAMFTN